MGAATCRNRRAIRGQMGARRARCKSIGLREVSGRDEGSHAEIWWERVCGGAIDLNFRQDVDQAEQREVWKGNLWGV